MAVLRLMTISTLSASDRQIGRLLALEDAIAIGRRAPKIIGRVISVGQQAANFRELMERIDRGNTVARGQRCDLHAMVGQENIRHRDQTAVWVARQGAKDGFELGRAVNRRSDRLYREGPALASNEPR